MCLLLNCLNFKQHLQQTLRANLHIKVQRDNEEIKKKKKL